MVHVPCNHRLHGPDLVLVTTKCLQRHAAAGVPYDHVGIPGPCSKFSCSEVTMQKSKSALFGCYISSSVVPSTAMPNA